MAGVWALLLGVFRLPPISVLGAGHVPGPGDGPDQGDGDRRDPPPWRRLRRDQRNLGLLAREGPPRLNVPHDDPRDAGLLLSIRPEPPSPRAGVAVLSPHLPPEDPRGRRAQPRHPGRDPRPLAVGE